MWPNFLTRKNSNVDVEVFRNNDNKSRNQSFNWMGRGWGKMVEVIIRHPLPNYI